tara:strand:+ start:2152 stop:2715 length:564 start_codon:yes stop_codon:yes gene_type:complete
MSTNGRIEVLEEMMLGTPESVEKSHKYTIFHNEEEEVESLPSAFLMELLLLFDSGVFDIDTLSSLFDVSIRDITLFTENYPAYWGWTESVATQWTKALEFYEDDVEDLAWATRYAIKRAEMAISMSKTLMEATEEMSKELEEDEGWDTDNVFMRIEGQKEQKKRKLLIDNWFFRSGFGGYNGEYTST